MKDQSKTKQVLIQELTSLRQQAAILERSELENAPDGIYMNDMEGNFLYGNRKCEEIIGYRRDELIGKNFLELNILTKDSLSKAARLLQANIEGKSTGPDEIELINKEGRIIPVEINTNVVQRMGQRIVLAFARDITERKRTEKALQESEESYRNLFENAGEAIFVAQAGKFVFFNPITLRMIGYSAEEIMSRPFIEFIHPDDRNMVINRHYGRIKENVLPAIYPFRFICGDGNIRWAELNVVLINWQGKPATLNFVNDITERKRTEEKLRQTLESLRKAFGTTVQVMVSAVEKRDPYTAGHQLRSADLARAIAMEMGLPQEKIDGIRMAGSIHDIGKLSIPAEILSKPTKLTESEFSMIKEHSRSGYEILKDVESPWPLAQIVYQHHERMDGSGYPRNLKGDEILMEARIMAVADVVESMASHRPYRPGLGIDAALEEIEKNKGTLYDNAVAEACLRLFREKGYQLQ